MHGERKDTDQWALENNYVAIVPVHLDLTAHHVISQIKNFVSSGRIDKLLLLHGPNGSAKTSIIQAITRAAEYYSYTDEWAIYQFSWIFPRR